MPKSANQKLKLLYLMDLFERESDETHPLSVQDIIAALAQVGIMAERKSIYSDIESLCAFGMDIVTVHGRSNRYYLGERTFEMPELKLLVDAVQSAKFISADKSRQLIKKLCSLTSRHEGGLMQRQVEVTGRAKTVSRFTYYNVDAIHNAIAQNHQLRFYYCDWVLDKTAPRMLAFRRRHEGRQYVVSPWRLVWDDEYYYLVAYDAHTQQLRHYRVDRMEHIEEGNEPRQGQEIFAQADITAYNKGVFSMFGGQPCDVRIRFANRLASVVVDRFGTDVHLRPDGDDHFIVTIHAVLSPPFYAWLFGFGADAQVLAPQAVADELYLACQNIASQYANAANAAENAQKEKK